MATMTNERRYALEWIDEHARRSPIFTCASGTMPNRPGGNTNRRRRIASCCAPRGSRSRKVRARCRPRSARAGGRSGPVLGTYAEYDAVPGNSQQVVCHQAPRVGLHPWAARHTDPHSALGTTALAGTLAAEGGDGEVPSPARSCCSASPPKRSAARSRCTPRRGITTAPTPSYPITPLHQHGDLGNAVRLLLECRLHLRNSRAGEVDRQEPDPPN
jgi:hypothetical protein